jgi:hypothetical protein
MAATKKTKRLAHSNQSWVIGSVLFEVKRSESVAYTTKYQQTTENAIQDLQNVPSLQTGLCG